MLFTNLQNNGRSAIFTMCVESAKKNNIGWICDKLVTNPHQQGADGLYALTLSIWNIKIFSICKISFQSVN